MQLTVTNEWQRQAYQINRCQHRKNEQEARNHSTERYSTYQCCIENPGEVEEKQMTDANFVFDEGSQ